MTRRELLQLTAAGCGALTASSVLAGPQDESHALPEKDFELNYMLASCMYGYMYVGEILPEVAKCGGMSLHLWPKKHGNQREQLADLGEERFAELLKKHNVKLGCITQYGLAPFGLSEEFQLARRFGCQMIVTGGDLHAPGTTRTTDPGNGRGGHRRDQSIAGVSCGVPPHNRESLNFFPRVQTTFMTFAKVMNCLRAWLNKFRNSDKRFVFNTRMHNS